MFRNLQIEWMKIKNYRVFQVFSVLYLLGIIVIIIAFYKVYINLMGAMTSAVTGGSNEGSDFFSLFGADNIWKTVGFASSLLLYLPGMIIINLFINEVNFKTHRQNIIDGWKRETFIYTKIGLILCMSAVIAVMNFIAVLIMMQITNVPFSFSGASTIFLCFLQAFIYLMFALFLATILRRSGVAIIVFFAYGLIFEWLLFWILFKTSPPSAFFLPLQVADSLVPFLLQKEMMKDMPAMIYLIIGALIYGGFYVYFSVRKYKNDDL